MIVSVRALWLVVALSACNEVFDLRPTVATDAVREFFDAPTDAPFTCPSLGGTPLFAPLFHQVIGQDCHSYQYSVDRQIALAMCTEPGDYDYRISQGPIDGLLTRLAGFDDPVFVLQDIRLAADGNALIAQYYATGPGYELRMYRFDGTTWTRRPNFVALPAFSSHSEPTRPPRHAFRTDGSGNLLELAEDAAGNWPQVAMYANNELGVFGNTFPRVSGDGLRLLLMGTPPGGGQARLWYADRPSITERFVAARPIEGVPSVIDPFLTEDCSRIYFSGLQQIIYVRQR